MCRGTVVALSYYCPVIFFVELRETTESFRHRYELRLPEYKFGMLPLHHTYQSFRAKSCVSFLVLFRVQLPTVRYCIGTERKALVLAFPSPIMTICTT
jgi:hypothetical protein